MRRQRGEDEEAEAGDASTGRVPAVCLEHCQGEGAHRQGHPGCRRRRWHGSGVGARRPVCAFAGGGVRDVQPRHAVRPWRELPVHPAANALCGEGLGEGKACDVPGPAGASLAPQGRGMADTPPPGLPGLHGESCTSRPVCRGDASLPGSQHKHPLQHHPDLQDTGGHRAQGVVLMPAPAVDHHRRFCHGLLEKLHPDHCPARLGGTTTQPGQQKATR